MKKNSRCPQGGIWPSFCFLLFAPVCLILCAVYFYLDAQCKIYEKKIVEGRIELERSKRELDVLQGRWSVNSAPESLEKLMILHGVQMARPRAGQAAEMLKNGDGGWEVRMHPETMKALRPAPQIYEQIPRKFRPPARPGGTQTHFTMGREVEES